MTPQTKNNRLVPKEGTPPTEEGLRLLLANGLVDHTQQTIDIWSLPFKIVTKDGVPTLQDSVVGAELWLKKFITQDPEMLQMKDDALKLSKIDDEVLILGETGTGKELIARAMIGDRQGSFYRINCAAMPKDLIESELFGHKIGAFTDAKSTKKGLMEVAKDGVLFLDEIGDLPLETQAKMLNALQPIDGKRYIRPVGSNEEIEINCRVVCATHRDLKSMCKDKLFRIDLYARISTFELHITPISNRKKDIEPIIKEIGFLLKKEKQAQAFLESKYMDDIMNDQVDLSLNVRSLEQAVKRFSVLGRV
jgi:transcriptional regulator with PAS, ATPase and Fis domain